MPTVPPLVIARFSIGGPGTAVRASPQARQVGGLAAVGIRGALGVTSESTLDGGSADSNWTQPLGEMGWPPGRRRGQDIGLLGLQRTATSNSEVPHQRWCSLRRCESESGLASVGNSGYAATLDRRPRAQAQVPGRSCLRPNDCGFRRVHQWHVGYASTSPGQGCQVYWQGGGAPMSVADHHPDQADTSFSVLRSHDRR